MKRKIVWLITICLIVAALVLISCAPGEEQPPSGAEMVKDPATGKMVKKPEYGGTITFGVLSEPGHCDPWYGSAFMGMASNVLEKLSIPDWALDREVWSHTEGYVPSFAVKPHLAESYETPDPLTIIFHIRKGVHWQDKPPMNGRELTAYDVEYSFHRFLGFGDFAGQGPTPYAAAFTSLPIESVTATDEWTVVFKLSRPSPIAFTMIYYDSWEASWIEPPEVIEQYGNLQDWTTLVGTGPFMLTDWTKGSSWTYDKNPDYWCYDEKFPDNRLPYIDQAKVVIIPDIATQLAALRTGQIAMMGGITLDQGLSLQSTNPELSFSTGLGLGISYSMPVYISPFDDIRVRQAMQLALDNDTINNSLYKGYGDTTPCGMISPVLAEFFVPYEDWPEEVKAGYRYDPEGAKKLLAEAGYPEGFKTTLETTPGWGFQDLDHAQVCKDYWKAIGVDVEILSFDLGAFMARIRDRSLEGMVCGATRGNPYGPMILYYQCLSTSSWNYAGAEDPVMDELLNGIVEATDRDELISLTKEADIYYIEQQWSTFSPRAPGFAFYWPWIGSYNGENTGIAFGSGWVGARVWVDEELRDELTG